MDESCAPVWGADSHRGGMNGLKEGMDLVQCKVLNSNLEAVSQTKCMLGVDTEKHETYSDL